MNKENLLKLKSGRWIITALSLVFIMQINPTPSQAADDDCTLDCRLAIQIAERFLPSLKISPAEQKLIRVENLYLGKSRKIDPNLWKLTFKDRSVIGSYGLIGKGGEIFIEVNLKEKKASFLGVGE